MKPYYEESGIVIYHADCRDILPHLGMVDCVVTDPVWPNSSTRLIGHEDPLGLFTDAMALVANRTNRVVVQMGCNSDPRFLSSVPACLPFLRVCSLRYAVASRQGRLLNNMDVGYVFGRPPLAKPGRHLMSGECTSASSGMLERRAGAGDHPTPRHFKHMLWLVEKFSDGMVLDPFMGSGTVLRAAKDCGLPAIGIEIEERHCETAAKRLRQEMLFTKPEVTIPRGV